MILSVRNQDLTLILSILIKEIVHQLQNVAKIHLKSKIIPFPTKSL
jgi:hypothetical protein